MKTFYARNRNEWRRWLRTHHKRESEIWLVYYKKHTNKPRVLYGDAVEEAICFGWIDSVIRRIDDERFAQKFTPRKRVSKWSALNIERAREMIRQKKMAAAGRAAFDERTEYDAEFTELRTAKQLVIPPEIEKALRKKKTAWANFTKLAPSHKRNYIGWITSAKRAETRQRRLREAIELLTKGQKLGMK